MVIILCLFLALVDFVFAWIDVGGRQICWRRDRRMETKSQIFIV